MPGFPKNRLSGRRKVASTGSEHIWGEKTATHIIDLVLHSGPLFLPSNNDFFIELLDYYLSVNNNELVAISSTGEMWDSQGYKVEGTLNGPYGLSAIRDIVGIKKLTYRVLGYVWERPIADSLRLF